MTTRRRRQVFRRFQIAAVRTLTAGARQRP
jgi:hypothetical protein